MNQSDLPPQTTRADIVEAFSQRVFPAKSPSQCPDCKAPGYDYYESNAQHCEYECGRIFHLGLWNERSPVCYCREIFDLKQQIKSLTQIIRP